MNTIERLIKLAEDQIGIKEDAAGHVKYSDEYGLPTQPWCMMFLWWLYKHSDLADIFYDGKKCAGCGTFLRWAQAKGGLVVDKPQRGDIAIISFGKDKNGNRITSHCGLITGVKGLNVETIEGNTCEVGSQEDGGHVMAKIRNKKLCMAYIRLPYPADDPGFYIYTVQKGDSLWRLAKHFYGSGVMYPKIKQANGLDKDTIYPGQQLKIPYPIIGGN